MAEFEPTGEQAKFLEHEGDAFVTAFPGAGKTRCILERAREVFTKSTASETLGFLSFTNAAVDELADRLSQHNILPNPVFPHFIGTFDSFIWHFMVAPFGHKDSNQPLQLIPDKASLTVKPYPTAQELALGCFDRDTGCIIPNKATEVGFRANPQAHETAAKSLRSKLLKRGQIDFEDARSIARQNLEDSVFSKRLARVLTARFDEIIIDEAQDCNPDDLNLIRWLRTEAEISTKLVCDPHQSIYGFRGGVTDQLFRYAEEFTDDQILTLSGNFRSSDPICSAVSLLRSPQHRSGDNTAVGELKNLETEGQVVSYKGKVDQRIGAKFANIAIQHSLDLNDCRLVAKTRETGFRSVGWGKDSTGKSFAMRLANAASMFHGASTPKEQHRALQAMHELTLILEGKLQNRTYHQAVNEENISPLSWRKEILELLRKLDFRAESDQPRTEWVTRARGLLSPYLEQGTSTIARRIPNSKALDEVLVSNPVVGVPPRTIHQVKGKEYRGICVVMTSRTSKGILDHLVGQRAEHAEASREIYVAASRAKELLVLACPKSQTERLVEHLSAGDAQVGLHKLWD